jgi:membrane fusion protein, heavy metal efflux system
VIFQIVDPAKLWVEALSFGAIGGLQNAAATAADGKPLKLAFRGSGLADRSQSIPVHFAVESGADGVRVGQFVTVFVASGEEKSGIVVPRTALVRGASGQEFVFEHVSPERFMPRTVRSEPLDGMRVIILAGLEAGKRVVVQGAELLDHVR